MTEDKDKRTDAENTADAANQARAEAQGGAVENPGAGVTGGEAPRVGPGVEPGAGQSTPAVPSGTPESAVPSGEAKGSGTDAPKPATSEDPSARPAAAPAAGTGERAAAKANAAESKASGTDVTSKKDADKTAGEQSEAGAAAGSARAAKANAKAEKAAAKIDAKRDAIAKKNAVGKQAPAGKAAAGVSEEPAPAPDTTATRKPRAARTVAKAIAAGTAGVASIALLGAVAAGGTLVPRSAGGQLAAVAADVPAGDSLSVCPAAPRLLAGAGDGTDAQFRPESSSASTVLRGLTLSDPNGRMPASGVRSLDGKTLQELTKASPRTDEGVPGLPDLKAAALPSRTPSGPEVLQIGTLDGKDSTGAAVLSYRAGDGDLRGLAGVTCQAPSSDQWLLGASTLVGRTSVLNLSNPSTTPATVNLELYGDKGQIKAPGSRGLSIGAGQSRSLVLAGLAPEQSALAVHVSSTGGPVTATVQQSVLRGLTPGGVDFIGPTGQPGTRQVITGVSLQGGAAAARLGSGFEDAVPTVALAVPGAQDAVVQLRVYGKNGQQAMDKGVVNAAAGTVTQVPLSGLPDGDYTIAVTSDVSVTAAVRVTRGTVAKDPTDFAWVPAAAPLGTSQVMAVPVAGKSSLQFGAPTGRAEISYRAITADGAIQPAAKATLAAGTSVTVDVPAKAGGSDVVGYLFSASGDPAYASLVQTEDKGPGVSVLSVPVTGSGLDKLPVRLGH